MSKQINYWQRLCAIPRFGFIHSDDGKRIIKAECLGNWIDRDEAMKIVDAAQDEISALQAERDGLRRQLEQAGQRGDAVAWQVRNGLVTHGFYCTEKEASKVRLDMQKAHDLGGSLSAFNLRPLYAAPVPPEPAEAAFGSTSVKMKYPS